MRTYQEILMERFDRSSLDKLDKMLLDDMCTIPSENGFEKEMLEWLGENPNASLQEIAAYEASFLEPLEIVDDGELDDEDD